MGVGLMQIGSGIEYLSGLTSGKGLTAHSGSYRYFYFRSVLRIRDREGLEENVLFHKLCIHLPSCCDPDPGPTAFILNMSTESLGAMLSEIPKRTMITNAMFPGDRLGF